MGTRMAPVPLVNRWSVIRIGYFQSTWNMELKDACTRVQILEIHARIFHKAHFSGETPCKIYTHPPVRCHARL